MQSQLAQLPQGIAVCSMGLDTARSRQRKPNLLVTRCQAGKAPAMLRLDLPDQEQEMVS